MVGIRHRSDGATGCTSSTATRSDDHVTSQSCDSLRNVNKGTTGFAAEKSCTCFKAKDFWRMYGSVIVKWCHVRNSNSSRSVNSRPPTTTPHPPPRSSSSSSPSSSSSSAASSTPEKDASPLAKIRISPASSSSPRSKSGSPLSSFVPRCISGRKSTDHSRSPSPAKTAAPSLSREPSQRSTSTATRTNPRFSRSASQRSTTTTASAIPRNFVFPRSKSQRSTSTTTATPHNFTRSASLRSTSTTTSTAIPHSFVFGRSASQRSTTTTAAGNNAGFTRNGSQKIVFTNSTSRRGVKPPPEHKNLDCTLEELFYGCTKKVKVTRDVVTNRGQIVQEEEFLTIQVKPGWKKGTTITYEEKGNQRLGSQPADLVFVIAEKGHKLFRREGNDLELTIGIPLVQALTGCEVSIPLMSNRGETMNLKIQDIIYPGYQKIIPGQGMPRSKEYEGERGDLRVSFLVEFPDELTEEQRSEVVRILEGCF